MVIHRLYDGYRSDETDSAWLSFVFMTDENLMCVDMRTQRCCLTIQKGQHVISSYFARGAGKQKQCV